jgi:hypothetical protein
MFLDRKLRQKLHHDAYCHKFCHFARLVRIILGSIRYVTETTMVSCPMVKLDIDRSASTCLDWSLKSVAKFIY